MKVLCVLLLLTVGGLAQDGKQVPVTPTCVATYFSGQVKTGLPFVQTIGSGLTYQLIPVESQAVAPKGQPQFIGWTIRIAYLKNRGEMEREFSVDMTPPYHGESPRELNTHNGRKLSEVFRAGHTVLFTTTQLDSATASKIMEGMQRSTSKENSSKIAHELDPIPIGSAALTIVDRQIQGDSAEPTVIQSLSFKVELVVPQSIKLPLDLAAKAHSATCPTLPSTINYTK